MADIKIMEEIFKAVDIITDKKIYLTEYVYTEDCVITSITNDNYVYRILHQGQEFDAYAPLGEKYSIGQNVVVLFTDYSRITKKIILYGNMETRRISQLKIENNLRIDGSAYFYNGITYGTFTPILDFGIDRSGIDTSSDYYFFTSSLSAINPVSNSEVRYAKIAFYNDCYENGTLYSTAHVPDTLGIMSANYNQSRYGFTYDPISSRKTGTVFNTYSNVKFFNIGNTPLDIGVGTANYYLTRYYYNGGAGSQFVGGIGTDGVGISWYSSSDYRLKENINEISNGLERIKLLNPISWTWKGTEISSEGFLAHEVEGILPIATKGEKDKKDADGNPVYQQLDLTKIIPTLVSAVKELSAEVELLKQKLQKLKEGDTINGP